MRSILFNWKILNRTVLALCIVMLTALTVPSTAQAGFIRSTPDETRDLSTEELGQLQDHLESNRLSEKLESLGLASDEILERVSAMTPDERQAVLQDIETLQAGGERISMSVVTFLLILILVVLIA